MPVGELRAVLDHQVEEVAAHLHADLCVEPRILRDLDVRHHQAELLQITPAVEVDSDHELERLELRDLLEEVDHG